MYGLLIILFLSGLVYTKEKSIGLLIISLYIISIIADWLYLFFVSFTYWWFLEIGTRVYVKKNPDYLRQYKSFLHSKLPIEHYTMIMKTLKLFQSFYKENSITTKYYKTICSKLGIYKISNQVYLYLYHCKTEDDYKSYLNE